MRQAGGAHWRRWPGAEGGSRRRRGVRCVTQLQQLCAGAGEVCVSNESPPLPPSPARSGRSRRPRLWLSPARPRDVTLQPSRAAAAADPGAPQPLPPPPSPPPCWDFSSLPPAAEKEAAIKLVCRSRAEIGGVVAGPGPRGGVGVGVVNSLRFHEILRSVARYRRRCRRRFR